MILEFVLIAGNIADRFFPGIEPIPAPDPRVQIQLIPNEPQHGRRQIYGVKYEDGISRT